MDEQVINGILHWKHKDGRWIPFSAEQLTMIIERTRQRLEGDLPQSLKRQAY